MSKIKEFLYSDTIVPISIAIIAVLVFSFFMFCIDESSDYITTYHIHYGDGVVDTIQADKITWYQGTCAAGLNGKGVYYISNALNLLVVAIDSTKKVH